MNLTELVSDIIDSEGLHTIALPFKEPVEIVVQHCIEKSVRTFSEFKRQLKESIVLLKDLKAANEDEKRRGIFLLPPELTTTTVKDVYAVCESDNYSGSDVTMNTFTVGSPFVGFGSYYPQDITNAELTDVAINKFAGQTTRRPTVKYLGYNKIQLFNYPQNAAVHFIVECEHDKSCESIPESCRESFLELATLDVEIYLYNNLKNQNNIGSGFKTTQLKLDDWAGAKEARKALIKEWTGTYHLDDTEAIMFF